MISAVFFACLCTLRPPTEAAETRCVELVLAWHQFARNLLPAHRAALCRPGGATGSSAGHPFPFAFAGGFVLCLEKGIVVDPLGFVLDFLDALEGRAVCGCVLLRKAVGVLLNPSPEVFCVEVVLILNLQFVSLYQAAKTTEDTRKMRGRCCVYYTCPVRLSRSGGSASGGCRSARSRMTAGRTPCTSRSAPAAGR